MGFATSQTRSLLFFVVLALFCLGVEVPFLTSTTITILQERDNNDNNNNYNDNFGRATQKSGGDEDVNQETYTQKNFTSLIETSRQRPGVMVLGMHRSGTSLLTGLLHTMFGYVIGGPVLPPQPDNPKGFFERVDFIRVNHQLMKQQNISWNFRVAQFNSSRAYEHIMTGPNKNMTARPLNFMKSPKNSPWIQKDPRQCITLKTWRHLMEPLEIEPAIIVTYRHPLEVALSLHKRELNFTVQRGLRLWIEYNRLAIQNSQGLCVVYTSNRAILEHPLEEAQRISNELTNKCHVPKPPQQTQTNDTFVDPKLQQQNNQTKGATNDTQHEQTLQQNDLVLLTEYNDGGCPVYQMWGSELKEGTRARKQETEMYLSAMKVYCDLQSGKAFGMNYEWPPPEKRVLVGKMTNSHHPTPNKNIPTKKKDGS